MALSSTDAEYMANSYAIQEGLYLRMLQEEMGVYPEKSGNLLLVDNQSSIKLVKNTVFHKRSKHIAIRFHFILEKVESGEIVALTFLSIPMSIVDLPAMRHSRHCHVREWITEKY